MIVFTPQEQRLTFSLSGGCYEKDGIAISKGQTLPQALTADCRTKGNFWVRH